MSAAELMEEMAKACWPLAPGQTVAVIVGGRGMMTLATWSQTFQRHVTLAVDVDRMTSEQFAEVMAHARTALDLALLTGSG